ncbi:MAG: FeoB-associated Cys-rich membrane protein [Eubacterium sp.]|nr:FeoB-associated Cys-rich membrane protein [Eubacterium sp.]
MDPVIGQIIVGTVVAVLAFFSGRAVLGGIKAELRGEKSCAGCSGCQSGKSCEECRMCERLEELRQQKIKETSI